MTRDAQLTRPDDTLRQAAEMMKDCDCGTLPVAGGDRLVGMITDVTSRSARLPMARAPTPRSARR
jgi:CBS domain-containing protein